MLPGVANPTLSSLSQDAARIAAEVEELVQGLDEQRLGWSPSAGQWSIAQCLEHLTAAGHEAYCSARVGLRRARAGRRSAKPLSPSPIGRWLIGKSGPEGTSKVSAPRRLAPPEVPMEGALERFLACHGRLQAVIRAVDGLDINRFALAAPISRLLPISLGEVLTIAVAHSRRHLEQARRVRRDPRFPGR
jgi:hypothetical protein